MAYKDCIAAMSEAIGRKLTGEEVEAIAEAVQNRMLRKRFEGLSDRDAAGAVGKEMSGEMALAAMIERRQAAQNLLTHNDLTARMKTGDEVKSEQAVLSGNARGGRNNANSTDANHHSLRATLMAPMVTELEKSKLLKMVQANDRDFNLDVARELRRRIDPTLEADTGNRNAKTVAGIFGKMLDAGRAMQNRAGAYIGDLEGYMGRQYHDMLKVRGAGPNGDFAAWRDAVKPLLDLDKMAPGLGDAQRDAMLHDVWKGLASGMHESAGNPAMNGFVGPANLAKKVSQSRSIIFKDADSWFKYNEQYGKGSVMDAMWYAADKAAHSTAVMQKLGTNPEAMFKRIHEDNLRRANDRGDFAMVDKLQGNPNQGLYDAVTGKASIPGNARLASIGANVRSVMQLKSLGGVLLSAFPDLNATSATLRANGIPIWEGLFHQMRSIMPVGEHAKEIAHALGAGIDGMTGHIVNRFRAEDGVPGKMTDIINMFHKINGLTYWTDAQKSGMGLALSHNLAAHAEKDFASLRPMMQDTLRQYGIEGAEWDTARATAQKAADGRHYLLPSEISDPAVSQKFQTYITDQIREGLNEPTARSRLITSWGTRPGTVSGEIVRSLMQFRNFTATYMERHGGRVFYRGGKTDWPGVIYLAVGMSLTGYVSNTLRDALSNKSPRMPETAGGWAALGADAIAAGGALGVIGDAIFRDSTKSAGDVLTSLAGPAPDMAAQLLGAIHAISSKATEDGGHSTKSTGGVAAQQAFKFISSNAPNLFYVKAAYDYIFGHALGEMVNPGTQRRYERLLKKNGQQQILKPALQ